MSVTAQNATNAVSGHTGLGGNPLVSFPTFPIGINSPASVWGILLSRGSPVRSGSCRSRGCGGNGVCVEGGILASGCFEAHDVKPLNLKFTFPEMTVGGARGVAPLWRPF